MGLQRSYIWAVPQLSMSNRSRARQLDTAGLKKYPLYCATVVIIVVIIVIIVVILIVITVGCLRRIWSGWVYCSLFPLQNQPQPTKNNLLWEKVAQMPLLTSFSWVGLALGWSSSVS